MDPKTSPQSVMRQRRDDYSMALLRAVTTVMRAEREANGRPVRPCPVCVPGWREAGAPWTLTHDGPRTSPRWKLVRQEGGRQVTKIAWSHNIDKAARRMIDFDATRPLVPAQAPVWLTEAGSRVLSLLEDDTPVTLTAAAEAVIARA